MPEISNSDDVIDSRDVIDRITELEDEARWYWEERHPGGDYDLEGDDEDWSSECSSDASELMSLRALQDEADGYAPDWDYGVQLIRDDYFPTYARELAEDIGAIEGGDRWPNYCIDWERAADELKMDYTAVEFDGVTYWVRG